MATRENISRIIELQKEIDLINTRVRNEYNQKKQELADDGVITKYQGIILYNDKIVSGGRTIALDSDVSVDVRTEGEISYSSEVKGGGSRPTLTRIAAGGIIAGPIGAVVGAAAQKKKKIETVTHEHDNRVVYLTITSKDGQISKSFQGTEASAAHDFADSVMNAAADYSKNKKDIEKRRKEVEAELKKMEQSDPTASQQKELNKIIKSLSDTERPIAEKLNKSINQSLGLAIGSIITCWVPFLGIILATAALLTTLKPRGIGAKFGKAQAAYILGFIALFMSFILSAVVIVNMSTSTTDKKTDSSSIEATDTTSEESSETETKADENEQKKLEAMRKCTVMEASDLIMTKATSDVNVAFDRAHKTCEFFYESFGEKDFIDSANIDWSSRKNEKIGQQTLDYYLNKLGW